MTMIKIAYFTTLPHYHGDENTSKIMRSVLFALVPALLMSVIFFGIDSFKITLMAVVCCMGLEYAIQKYLLKVPATVRDGSAAVTGMLLAFCLPVSSPVWMVAIGSLVSIGLAKLAFGGIGKNPFNPALVGALALALLFPGRMTAWTANITTADSFTGATPLGLLKVGLNSGKALSQVTGEMQLPGYFDLFWGNISGSLGEISSLAILIGGIYLLWKKIISWQIPVSIISSIVLVQGILWLLAPGRFMDPIFHLITGAVMLGAIFLATDPATSPANPHGQVVFGAGIGVITLLIRNFSPYPEGVGFAILFMNGVTPLINKKFPPLLVKE